MVMSKRPRKGGKNGCSCSMPGVWRAAAYNEGAAVIFHSPKACGHVTHDMDLSMHYRALARQQFQPNLYTAPLISSNLEEQHSIFGGTDQLRACIEYVAQTYKPLYILIANSCVAGVIGDDTEAVASQVERELGLPILVVASHGFLDGDYYSGFYYASKALAERFIVPMDTEKHTVTLLGDHGGPDGADAREMKQLLRFFGLQVRRKFPVYANLADIKQIASSELCILLGGTRQSFPKLRQLAGDLNRQVGVPFFDSDYPVGLAGTRIWLTKLGAFLQKEVEAAAAIKDQEKRLDDHITFYRQKMKNKRCVLCIGRPLSYFQPDWILELFSLTETGPEGIILLDGLTGGQSDEMQQEVAAVTKAPVYRQQEGNDLLAAADLILTTHEMADWSKRQVFLPLLPPVGVTGIINVMHKMVRLAERYGTRGGIMYV
ncbi:nitrogenase component 1 [Anaerospora hongkongensis]|uniref:nitrogenase component 1 n=1 Tax=Anaerospora hongkongensis TaxID=244830 RepID=UPI0028A22ECA|nr:nitrogenase component 1 [Anaerospora hongkongensis]